MSDEYAASFIDTNILIYAHDNTAGEKHEIARKLVMDLGRARLGALSLQVLQEFFVNVTRKIPRPLSPQEASTIISDLAVWRRHEPKLDDILAAAEIHERLDISFWDAMIVRSAQQLSCPVIWSEDLNPDQVYEGTRAANPFR